MGTVSDDHDATLKLYQAGTIAEMGVAADRLTWSGEQLKAFTNDQLGAFLDDVSKRSPWHRERLANIDLDAVSADDMSTLPTMNKQDLGDNWDSIVTDPRITLARANEHLRCLATDGFSFALGKYVVSATGGSTGHRSVIATDVSGFAASGAALSARLRANQASGATSGEGKSIPVRGQLAAQSAIHLTGAIAAIMGGATSNFVRVPPSMPIAQGVAKLNQAQPDTLSGYGSLLHLMALEALAGRLHIAPKLANNGGEPLLPETREVFKQAFGIDLANAYGASEAAIAASYGGSELLHLADDSAVIELVDVENNPVSPGTRSAKMLVTTFANRLQPLIRYEITDEVTEAVFAADGSGVANERPGPWAGRWIHSPLGRSDDWFTYGNTVVHPHVFRSHLAAAPGISEYQVHQTRRGARLDVVAGGTVDTAAISAAIVGELTALGIEGARVEVQTVMSIERHPNSGKLRRFIPLG